MVIFFLLPLLVAYLLNLVLGLVFFCLINLAPGQRVGALLVLIAGEIVGRLVIGAELGDGVVWLVGVAVEGDPVAGARDGALVVGIRVGAGVVGRRVGTRVGGLVKTVGLCVVTGDKVTGAREGAEVGIRVGAEAGRRVGAGVAPSGTLVGALVGPSFARQRSDVASTWHCPSQAPPRKHPAPTFSLNSRFPGAGQLTEPTSLSTKFNEPEKFELLSTNTTKVESEFLKQVC